MRTVFLGDLPKTNAYKSVQWLAKTLGPAGDRWQLRELAYIDFKRDRDATLFLTAWG